MRPALHDLPVIAVVGLGQVGDAVMQALAGRATIRGHDVDPAALEAAEARFGRGAVEGQASDLGPADVLIDCMRGAGQGARAALIEGVRPGAIIHISSFAVYGARSGAVRPSEGDQPNPVTEYGWSKLAEECEIAACAARSVSLRLCGYVGRWGGTGSRSSRYAHSVAAGMARGDEPPAPANLSEYLDEARFAEFIRVIVRRVAGTPRDAALPPVLNLGGGSHLTNARLATLWQMVMGWPLTGVVESPPPPQMPCMSGERLTAFLGSSYPLAYDLDMLERAFWAALFREAGAAEAAA